MGVEGAAIGLVRKGGVQEEEHLTVTCLVV